MDMIAVDQTGAANLRDEQTPKVLGTPLLVKIGGAIMRHKPLIASIIGACLALGILATLLAPARYTATTSIEISRLQNKVTNVEGVEDEDAGQTLEFYQTQYALLEARSIAERVARRLGLAADEAYLQAFDITDEEPQDAATRPAGSVAGNGARERRLEEVIDSLQENIAISPIRGSSLVDLSFTSKDPELSAKIVNGWAQEYIQSTLDRRFASSADARKFLEGRIEELRTSLENSERALVAYAANRQIIPLATSESLDGRTRTERTLVGQNLENLNVELANATAARIRAESVARTASSASAQSLGNQALNQLREELGLAEAEYAKLMAQFEPGYPPAQAVASRVTALRRAIVREESRVGESARTELQQARARENELQAAVNQLKSEALGQRSASIQYNILQREVDTNRELYDALLQRYRELGVAGVGMNNVQVVDAAEVPERPSSPSLPLNLALALVAGLALAAAAVFAAEQIDQSLSDPKDLDRVLGVPVLGSVPNLPEHDLIAELRDKKSQIYEAYLSSKTSLSFLTDHGVPRSFMLSSTIPNEGKSISSLALAVMLVNGGKRALLIDADMRNPSLADAMGMPRAEGLTNYLSGAGDWQSLVRPAVMEGLQFLDAGPIPPNAAELLGSARFSELIRAAAANYDHVIVDGPPVLGLADAPLISSSVEGIVYVVQANRVRMRGIASAIDRLRAAHANIFGAIVTRVGQRNAEYGYGSGYGYGYGYGANSDAGDESREGRAPADDGEGAISRLKKSRYQ